MTTKLQSALADGTFSFADLASITTAPGSPDALTVCDSINKVAVRYATDRGLAPLAATIESAHVSAAYVFALVVQVLCASGVDEPDAHSLSAVAACATVLKYLAPVAPESEARAMAASMRSHCLSSPAAVIKDGDAIGQRAARSLTTPAAERTMDSLRSAVKELAAAPPPVDIPWWGWMGAGVAATVVARTFFRGMRRGKD